MRLSDAETDQALKHADMVLALKPEEIEADRKACPNGLLEIVDGVLGYLRQARRVGVGKRIVELMALRGKLTQEEMPL